MPEAVKTKTILFITGRKNAEALLAEPLRDEFSFRFADNIDEGYEILAENYLKISLVLIDDSCAACNDYDFFKRIKKKTELEYAAVITVSFEGGISEECIKSLEAGAMDVIALPCRKEIMTKRINNAIRLSNSTTFIEIEDMLAVLPSNIYLKDREGKYIFCTHYWHHLEHNDDPDWTIRGKTDVDIRKDRENALAAMEADKEMLRTGKGTSYIIEINSDGIREFMQIIKQPLFDKENNITGIIGLINDVTEHEVLKEKLREASTIDALTGIFNRREIQAAVERGLAQSKKNGMPFSLLMFDIDNFKTVNDTYGHQLGDKVLIEFSKILKNNSSACGGKYISGRWGGEEFMMALSNTDISAAMFIGELIRHCFENLTFSEMRSQTVSVGAACAIPEDTVDTLCSRVDAGLYKAKKKGKNRVESV